MLGFIFHPVLHFKPKKPPSHVMLFLIIVLKYFMISCSFGDSKSGPPLFMIYDHKRDPIIVLKFSYYKDYTYLSL